MVPLAIIYLYNSKRINEFKLDFAIDFDIWKKLLSNSWPLAITAVLASMSLRIDQVILFHMTDEKSLGLYASAVRIVEAFHFIPAIFMVSIFPILSSTFEKANDRFMRISSLSYKYMSIIIIPIAFGTTLLSRRLTSLIFGVGFVQASAALSVLVWSEIFVFLGTIFTNIVTAAGCQKYAFSMGILGVTINIGLNLILIPRYGISGAAVATVISYGSTMPPFFFIKKIRPYIINCFSATAKPIVCSIPMSIFIYYCYSFNLAILVVLSALIYCFFLFATKCIDQEDIRYFKLAVNWKTT